jgi:hypothetical protein
MKKDVKTYLNEEKGDVGLVFKVIVGVVIGAAVLGLLLSMLNIPLMGTNEFAIQFTTPSSGIDPNGGCISTSGSDEKTNYQIKGIVKNVKGGFVSGAKVEATGVGYSDVDVTGEDGVFELKSDFLL